MPITSDEAARIARAHGLTITDAAALRALCDDTGEASRIAATFAEPDENSFVRDLFAPPENPGTGFFAPPTPKGPAA